MKYLIDTQILIWYQINSDKLKREILDILNTSSNQIFVSDISLLEISIKQKINKLPELPVTINDIIEVAMQNDFSFIPLSHEVFVGYGDLEMEENHRDPFDRVIISTAIVKHLSVISADEKFTLYNHLIKIVKA